MRKDSKDQRRSETIERAKTIDWAGEYHKYFCAPAETVEWPFKKLSIYDESGRTYTSNSSAARATSA